jgi:hypothetical protein
MRGGHGQRHGGGARSKSEAAWRSAASSAWGRIFAGLRERYAKVNQVYDDEARKWFFDKINRVAANLGLDEPRTAIEGAAHGRNSGEAAGKEKRPGGSAQVFENAQFGEGKASFFFAEFCPSFAGFGSNLAKFGFGFDFP